MVHFREDLELGMGLLLRSEKDSLFIEGGFT